MAPKHSAEVFLEGLMEKILALDKLCSDMSCGAFGHEFIVNESTM